MPVASLFDYLGKGGTIDEFLEWFPGHGPNCKYRQEDGLGDSRKQ